MGTAAAPADYATVALTTLTFNPGEVTKTVSVNVNGDFAVEPDETFFVNLSSPTNATILDAQGQGTIQNDDAPPFLTLSIDDVSVIETATGSVDGVVHREPLRAEQSNRDCAVCHRQWDRDGTGGLHRGAA